MFGHCRVGYIDQKKKNTSYQLAKPKLKRSESDFYLDPKK